MKVQHRISALVWVLLSSVWSGDGIWGDADFGGAGVRGVRAGYVLDQLYSGATFFDGWDFYGNVDNTTWGNVTYVDAQTATSSRLAYVDNSGIVTIRVDNTTNIPNTTVGVINRPTIKITSKESFAVGSLIIMDLLHIPYGCSVWPALWTMGEDWPNGGEIDIIEAVNNMPSNQMAVHALSGCVQSPNKQQTGNTVFTDCSIPAGCTVGETKPNSYGPGFASNGGGVWATQFDVSGIYIWFWPRNQVPQSINNYAPSSSTSGTITLADWGLPSASYPADTCNITQYFTPQKLVIDTTLCGDWAGIPQTYASTCPNMGQCISQIYGASNPIYANAYWQIKYIRTFTAAADVASSATSSVAANSPPASSPGAVTETETSTTMVDPVETGGSGDTLGSGSGAVSMAVGLRGGWLWVVMAGMMTAMIAL